MNTNLNKIAQDLYKILEPRFTDVQMGDEQAQVLSKKTDVPKARFFEFEYKHDGVPLGTIAITLDEDDGLLVELVGDLAKKDHPAVFKFIRGLRKFSKDRLINFKIDKIGKSSLDKRDYEFRSKPKEQEMEPIMESKMYGTAKISYQDLDEARLVIKHSQPVNPEVAAGRTMHIDSIYVENSQGERFKYPFKHLNGARALAEHLKHGGIPYDAIGKHITSLSEELAQLRKFKGYVGRNAALSEAMGDITDKVFERIEEVKKEVAMLQRPSYYELFAESFEDHEEQMIPEAVMDDWIDRLTIRTFNEELKTAFPYIFRLVGENIPVKELSPDDLLDEERTEEKDEKGNVVRWKEEGEWVKAKGKEGRGKVTNLSDKARRETEKMAKKDESLNPEARFESFLDSITEDEEDQDGHNTLFSQNIDVRGNALKQLKQILAPGLPAGQNGLTASLSLKGIIDSEKFTKDYLSRLGPDDDAGVAVKMYLGDLADEEIHEPFAPHAQDIAKELIASNELNFDHSKQTPVGGEVMPASPAPVPPAPAAPEGLPPEAGAPEGLPPEAGAPGELPPEAGAPGELPPEAPIAEGNARLKAKLIKVFEAGASLDTELDFGHRVLTLGEAMEECGIEMPSMNSGESPANEILKSISGFWNSKEKNFTIGGTRVKTRIVKGFKEGEYGNATTEDVKKVMELVDRMDPSEPVGEISHISKLAGVQKPAQGIEVIQATGNPQDIMKSIMSKLAR